LIGLNNSYKYVVLFRTGATPISAVLLRCFNCGLDITGKVGLNNTVVQAGTGQAGTGEVKGGIGQTGTSQAGTGQVKGGQVRPSRGNARLYYVRLE
jgi:hypothetical protein